MARSAISLVRGETKIFLSSAEHLPEALRALEGACAAQPPGGHLEALVSAQDLLLNVAGQLLPGKKVKSLRDVAFFTKGKIQPSLQKRLVTLNTVHSFLRKTSAAAILHTADQIAEAMASELVRSERSSALSTRSRSLISDDRSAACDDSADEGTDASTWDSAPPTERGAHEARASRGSPGAPGAGALLGSPPSSRRGEALCEAGSHAPRGPRVEARGDPPSEPSGRAADAPRPLALFQDRTGDLNGGEGRAFEAASPSPSSSSGEAPSPPGGPGPRARRPPPALEAPLPRGRFGRHVPRGSKVALVHDTCFPAGEGKLVTISAGKLGTFAGFDVDGDAEVIFDSPRGATPYFFGQDRFFHLGVLK